MSRLVNTAGAAKTKASHIASPTPMMPSWLPCRRRAEGGAMRLSTGRFGIAPVAMASVHRTGARDAIEAVDELVHCDLALGVDARDLAAIEHIKPVDDRVNMKNVVIDEDRRFARFLDAADEIERLAGFVQ